MLGKLLFLAFCLNNAIVMAVALWSDSSPEAKKANKPLQILVAWVCMGAMWAAFYVKSGH